MSNFYGFQNFGMSTEDLVKSQRLDSVRGGNGQRLESLMVRLVRFLFHKQ